jgi:heavy metal sensor kinase
MIAWAARWPVAARMAALTSAALIAMLVVVGFLIHRQLGRTLRAEIDSELTGIARAEAKALVTRPGQDPPALPSTLPNPPTEAGGTPLFEAQVLTQEGAVLARTAGLREVDALLRGGALVRVAAGVVVHGDTTIKGDPHRFAAAAVPDDSGRLVAVASPIQEVTAAEGSLLSVYIPAAIAAAAAAAVAGWWIAKRSLAPLRAFAAEAEAIGTLDLSQRLLAPRTDDEVGRLTMTLNRMLDRLDAAVERERQLTGEVGHELRTPLAVIRAETELLLEGVSEPALRASSESILEEVDRIRGVIEDMLLLARADAEGLLDRPELVDLGKLARGVATRFSAIATAKRVSLSASGEGVVRGDPHAIERAITNLVVNALRHTPDEGSVEIEVEGAGGAVLVIVRDTGPGIAEDIVEKMFDRYARGGSRHGAAGLGLAIVAAVAASHGGNVQARNRPTGGLEVAVELR